MLRLTRSRHFQFKAAIAQRELIEQVYKANHGDAQSTVHRPKLNGGWARFAASIPANLRLPSKGGGDTSELYLFYLTPTTAQLLQEPNDLRIRHLLGQTLGSLPPGRAGAGMPLTGFCCYPRSATSQLKRGGSDKWPGESDRAECRRSRLRAYAPTSGDK